MREGELFGLRKQDVNWKTKEITVRRSWDGETTKSRRDLVVPIAKDLMPYLRAALESSDSELVFPNREGRMHSRNLHVNERIRTALKAAGIIVGYDHKCRRCKFKVRRTSSSVTKCPQCGFALWVSPVPKDISIHKLRHTTGTLLSKAGVPIQIIQRVLGHTDIKGDANYAAAKARVIKMTKEWARELGRSNIRVNAVAPGFTATEL